MRQSLRRLGTTAVAVPGIAVLALAGCKNGQDTAKVQPSGPASPSAGSAAPGSSAPAPPPQSGSPTTAAKTNLTITVQASKTAKARTWTLTCDPVGGDLADRTAACATLAKASTAGKDPFTPTPKGQMCTQIYGGPEVATVKGTWNGKKVDSTFNRKNGCEIKRWSDLKPLFGPVPPVR
jgi:hypothetical protein